MRISPEGPKTARIAFIGEAGGVQEGIAGRPFIGRAGRIYDRCLGAAGLPRSTV